MIKYCKYILSILAVAFVVSGCKEEANLSDISQNSIFNEQANTTWVRLSKDKGMEFYFTPTGSGVMVRDIFYLTGNIKAYQCETIDDNTIRFADFLKEGSHDSPINISFYKETGDSLTARFSGEMDGEMLLYKVKKTILCDVGDNIVGELGFKGYAQMGMCPRLLFNPTAEGIFTQGAGVGYVEINTSGETYVVRVIVRNSAQKHMTLLPYECVLGKNLIDAVRSIGTNYAGADDTYVGYYKEGDDDGFIDRISLSAENSVVDFIKVSLNNKINSEQVQTLLLSNDYKFYKSEQDYDSYLHESKDYYELRYDNKEHALYYLYQFNPYAYPDDWKSLGVTFYDEPYFCGFFTIPAARYLVEIEENNQKPGVYRLKSPYGKDSFIGYYSNITIDTEEEHHIIIDASNPNRVFIPEVWTGASIDGYGRISVTNDAGVLLSLGYSSDEVFAEQPDAFGTKVGNVITFKRKNLILHFDVDNQYYYANFDKDFVIKLPDGGDSADFDKTGFEDDIDLNNINKRRGSLLVGQQNHRVTYKLNSINTFNSNNKTVVIK